MSGISVTRTDPRYVGVRAYALVDPHLVIKRVRNLTRRETRRLNGDINLSSLVLVTMFYGYPR